MQCIIAMLYSGCVDVADFIKCITACRLHFPEGEKKRKSIHPSPLAFFCFVFFFFILLFSLIVKKPFVPDDKENWKASSNGIKRERYTKDMMGFDFVRAGLRYICQTVVCVCVCVCRGERNNNNKSRRRRRGKEKKEENYKKMQRTKLEK